MKMLDKIYLEEKLKGEYKEAYERIELYSNISNMDDEMVEDLLDTFITAQEDGVPVEKIIGDDIEKFCKDYFSEYGLKAKLGKFPKRILYICKIIFILELIDFFANLSDSNSLSNHTDLSPFLCGFAAGTIMSGVIYLIIRPVMFKSKKIKPGVFYWLIILIFVAGVVVTTLFIDGINLEVSRPLLLVITGAYILVYTILKLVGNYKKYGTIRKPKEPEINEGKVAFWLDVKKEITKNWVKRYNKTNEKMARKGKAKLELSEYMKKLHKECDSNKSVWGIVFIFVAITVGYIAGVALSSTLVDALIFTVILCIAELLLMKFLIKNQINSLEIQRSILKECEEQCVTLIEYAKNFEEEED